MANARRPSRGKRPGGWLQDEPASSFPTQRNASRRRPPDDYDDYDERQAYDGGSPPDEPAGPPLLTLPSVPAMPAVPSRRGMGGTGKQRTLATATGRRRALPAREAGDSDDHEWEGDGWDDAPSPPARRRERSSARPLARPGRDDDRDYDEGPGDYGASRYDGYDREAPAARSGSQRALVPYAAAAQEIVPELATFRIPAQRRRRLNTRAIARHARSPWSITRLILAVASVTLALVTAFAAAGEPHQALMAAFQTNAGSHDARSIASLVQPETQMMRPDLYDSYQQFVDWGDAACSAATLSEVLTAWGVPHATIGHTIDVMEPDISLDGGLLRPEGYQRGASAYGYRADITGVPGTGQHVLTYDQILYVANQLGLPVIVNVRISYGYYHFFSGGHFLVVTGGDDQGLKIVDSSEYYIHYLPKDVFYSMFTGMTVIVVPKDYRYTISA